MTHICGKHLSAMAEAHKAVHAAFDKLLLEILLTVAPHECCTDALDSFETFDEALEAHDIELVPLGEAIFEYAKVATRQRREKDETMGTNYYWSAATQPPCVSCGRAYEEEQRHIGKSSAGWAFGLHVYPEDGINDLPDWQRIYAEGVIRDEYGDVHSPTAMTAIITERVWKLHGVPLGYESWKQFHSLNTSAPGPNGLVRHAIGRHCVSHGSGTWDCIVGDFS